MHFIILVIIDHIRTYALEDLFMIPNSIIINKIYLHNFSFVQYTENFHKILLVSSQQQTLLDSEQF